MQAAIAAVALPSPVSLPTLNIMNSNKALTTRRSIPKCFSTKSNATMASDEPTAVDYNSMLNSVFPAEACETIGGEACDVEMYPEVILKSEPRGAETRSSSEQVDREYLEYNSSKTVFPGEACDDLGGEFCEPEYQKGVY